MTESLSEREIRSKTSLEQANHEISRQRGNPQTGDITKVNSPTKTGTRQPPKKNMKGSLAGVNAMKDPRQRTPVPSGKMRKVNTNVNARQQQDIPSGSFGNPNVLISPGVNMNDTRQKAPGKPMGNLDDVNNVRSRQRKGDDVGASHGRGDYFDVVFGKGKRKK
jgi:hypothetical protein